MPNVPIQVRVPAQMKKEADEVFAEMGLKTTDAIRMFLQQTINRGSLPFSPKTRQPKEELLEALYEARSGKGKVYTDIDEMFAEWDNL